MTLIILPDPTTRRCPVHRDNLMTDSRPCLSCEGKRMVDEILERATQSLREALN
jgi:hypothetical protein